MRAFLEALGQLRTNHPPAPGERAWYFLAYDQLSEEFGPLARLAPEQIGIVLVESAAKARRRPYHKQKLAMVLANLRHFALEQAQRGVEIEYLAGDHSYADALGAVIARRGRLRMMRPAERELRVELRALVERGDLVEEPHDGWLTGAREFVDAVGPEPPWRMDAFYRYIRRQRGILMDERNKPLGGRFSHDGDNRQAWSGDPPAPGFPRFEADPITREVAELIETKFADHPGELELERLPSTRADAQALWTWARSACMEHFGPYEDAMSLESRGLFHTRISPLVNLGRLSPRRLLDDVLALDIPLSSKEGFVRQLIGWREFVHHVHEATDGFRRYLPPGTLKTEANAASEEPDDPLASSRPNFMEARVPLPPAYWGRPSGLRCLDEVVESVWAEGWSHHITRLMVSSNIAMLLDVDPRELTDWFWVAYTDAYDWVVEPNVLAMGSYAVGDLMTTKPYVAGSGYIHKMSDYCRGCAFHPKKNCPLTPMYWAYLDRNAKRLEENLRVRIPLRSLERRKPAQRSRDRAIFEAVRDALAAGDRVTPEGLGPTKA